MSTWQAALIGAHGGLAIGFALISATHRRVWGHWRFWRFEVKHRRPR
jgi:hypothetical protein